MSGDDVSGALGGAAGIAAATGVGLPIAAGLGVASLAAKFFLGKKQDEAAKRLATTNPGYQPNQAIIDNARMQEERYRNYGLPGYNQLLTNLNQSYQTGLSASMQGASSGNDILDAANKLNFNQNQALNGLALQQAVGKGAEFDKYLSANAMAGQENVGQNQYDRDVFQQQLGRQQQLTDAAAQNQYGAVDQAGKLVASMLAYRPQASTVGSPASVSIGSSIFG